MIAHLGKAIVATFQPLLERDKVLQYVIYVTYFWTLALLAE